MGLFLFICTILFRLFMMIAIIFAISFQISRLQRSTLLQYNEDSATTIFSIGFIAGISPCINVLVLMFLIMCPIEYILTIFYKLHIMEEK